MIKWLHDIDWSIESVMIFVRRISPRPSSSCGGLAATDDWLLRPPPRPHWPPLLLPAHLPSNLSSFLLTNLPSYLSPFLLISTLPCPGVKSGARSWEGAPQGFVRSVCWKFELLTNSFVQIEKYICLQLNCNSFPNCKFISPKCKMFCPNCKIYFSKLVNLFAQIAKCTCPNCKIYLSKLECWILFCMGMAMCIWRTLCVFT